MVDRQYGGKSPTQLDTLLERSTRGVYRGDLERRGRVLKARGISPQDSAEKIVASKDVIEGIRILPLDIALALRVDPSPRTRRWGGETLAEHYDNFAAHTLASIGDHLSPTIRSLYEKAAQEYTQRARRLRDEAREERA